MTISFSFSHISREPVFDSPSDVLDRHLRFNLFLGDIIWRVNGCDMSTQWGWIPLVGLAKGMLYASSQLELQSKSDFLFTENDERILLERIGDSVVINATYSDCVATQSLHEFRDSVFGFASNLFSEVHELNPTVANSQAFQRIEAKLAGNR